MSERNLEHLELVPWREPQARKKVGGGRPLERGESAQTHGVRVLEQTEAVSRTLEARISAAPMGINPKLVFKLQLHPKGYLDDDQLRKLGLHVLERDPGRAVVVFPDEASLAKLQRRLEEYSGQREGGHQYSYLAAIDAILDLAAADRIGLRLAAAPLAEGETEALDIELFHTGDRDECNRMIDEVRDLLANSGLAVTDHWVGASMVLLRARVNAEALSTLVQIDYVREVNRRSEPSFDMHSVSTLDIDHVEIAESLPKDAPGVLVIDSGVMSSHPLLAPIMGDAQVFPDRLRLYVIGGPEDADIGPNRGHGTAVAGLAVFGDLSVMVETRQFFPSAALFSARVTNDQGNYDCDSLIEHQLEEALDYFLSTYPSVKVVNISLGERDSVCRDKQLQFRFAATIDELAYRYRNRDVLFVVSAGNYSPDDRSGEDVLRMYPDHLVQTDQSRVIDPATSAIALTVGGLSYGSAVQLSLFGNPLTDRLVASERAHPSSFTRTGWGLGGSIKPDVVDFAGDVRFERGDLRPNPAQYAGVPTTARNFAPPDGRILRTVAGTSFAAPKVSNMACQLFGHFPSASSNLIRALIGSSARVPSNRPGRLANLPPWEDDILRVYGNGQPNIERAEWSAENAVLLLDDATLELDHFRLYELPSLPDVFLEATGSGYMSVCLAFDPPTRRSRADYLGVRMQFRLFRNVSPERLAMALGSATNEELEAEDDDHDPSLGSLKLDVGMPIDIELRPKSRRRSLGTLQRGVARVTSSKWQYDGNRLVLAVICRRVWAAPEIKEQRYAVVATIEHEQPDVELYNHARQQARVSQRVRVRA